MSQQLERLEVPRMGIDFLDDNLTGYDKLTVLKYLELDRIISQIGRQRFDTNVRNFIPIQPVRDWVMEKWQGDTSYDLSHRNLPITFRTS